MPQLILLIQLNNQLKPLLVHNIVNLIYLVQTFINKQWQGKESQKHQLNDSVYFNKCKGNCNSFGTSSWVAQ